jgi:hypothetical protein
MADPRKTGTAKTPPAPHAQTKPIPAPPTATSAQPPAEAAPHPSSSHRTPREIAKEEAGPGGPSTEPQGQEASVGSEKAPSKEEEHIRAAVQRSAHQDRTRKPRRVGTDPHRSGNR